MTASLKPSRFTRTVNVPGGTVEKVAVPTSLVTAVRVHPVSVCAIVTVARGIAAPLSSFASTTNEP